MRSFTVLIIRLAEMGADGLWDVLDCSASLGMGGRVFTRCLDRCPHVQGFPSPEGSFGGVGALPGVTVPCAGLGSIMGCKCSHVCALPAPSTRGVGWALKQLQARGNDSSLQKLNL